MAFSTLMFASAFGRRQIGRRQTLEHVEIARLQVGEPHGRVRDRQEGHGVEVDLVGVPVVVELLEHDAVLLHALA